MFWKKKKDGKKQGGAPADRKEMEKERRKLDAQNGFSGISVDGLFERGLDRDFVFYEE